MLILKGAQGIGKSTFFKMICNNNTEIYQENLKDINNGFEYTNGRWFVEMGELAAMKKTDIEQLKIYISQTSETHRRPYERAERVYKRQFVLIGTTNEDIFLVDETGNRRFLIVELANDKTKKDIKKNLFTEEAQYEAKQILAEAFEEYKSGNYFLTVPTEFNSKVEKTHRNHILEDPDIGIIEEYLEYKTETCAFQVWCEALGHKISDKRPKSEMIRIGRIIENLPNWSRYEGNSDGKKRITGVVKDYMGDSYRVNYGSQKAFVKLVPEIPTEITKIEENNEMLNKMYNTENLNYFMKIGETENDNNIY